MDKRSKRLMCFADSASEFRKYFLDKAKTTNEAEYFMDYFGIEAVPDSKTMKDSSYCKLYWKDRIIDIDNSGADKKETGAKISIRRSIKGYVSIELFPFYTEGLKCREDSIVLFHRLNPCWLCQSLFLFFLWKTFISYSSVTAIDGNPTFLAKLIVNLLRYLCTMNVGGVKEETRLWHDLKILVGLFFTFVSSSLFVYFLPARNDTKKLHLIEEIVSTQKKQIDSIIIETSKQKDIIMSVDSLIYLMKLVEKNTTPQRK